MTETSTPAPTEPAAAPTAAQPGAPTVAQPGAPTVAASSGRRPAPRSVSVAVVGAAGYAGGELVRLLAAHPSVRIAGLYGRNRDHEPITASHPQLAGMNLVIDQAIPEADVVFCALPHGVAASMAGEIVGRGSTLIDIGPDFRLHDPADYPRWYGFEHPRPDLLAQAVYGIPELHRAEIAEAAEHDATIVGLAGCYPTTTILGLAPLARAGLIGDLVVDAKSGVSGAGREAKADLVFSEVNENVKAYGLFTHRHTAEIEQELVQQGERGTFAAAGANPGARTVDFLPHLIPMTRGILASCHVRPTRPVGQSELDALYAEAYRDEPFVRVMPAPPSTKHVYGSNQCRIHVRLNERTGRILVLSVTDNLVKGAAGQAVQAMNVVLGLPETTGLEALPVAP